MTGDFSGAKLPRLSLQGEATRLNEAKRSLAAVVRVLATGHYYQPSHTLTQPPLTPLRSVIVGNPLPEGRGEKRR